VPAAAEQCEDGYDDKDQTQDTPGSIAPSGLYGQAGGAPISRSSGRIIRIVWSGMADRNVCLWHKADMAIAISDVRFWG